MFHAAKPFMRRLKGTLPLAPLMLALGACSSSSEVFSKDSWFARPLTFTTNPSPNAVARHQISDHRPLGAADFVDTEGRCPAGAAEPAAMAAASPSGETPQAASVPGATPASAGGVALEMSECEVVRRIGQPERVEIGSNERSERSVVITYLRGPRPGIYRFVAGRLTVIEKAPDATPPRPARPSRPPRA